MNYKPRKVIAGKVYEGAEDEYPDILKCPHCNESNTLDSRFCKSCGRWLVGEWKGIQFKKARIERVAIGWQWIALAAVVGIIIGILIGVALS